MKNKMKMLKIIVKIIMILFIYCYLIPKFFNIYSDLRFFWSFLAVLLICINTFLMITREKSNRKKYFTIIVALILSIVMANELYSYKTLVAILPFLKPISNDFLFASGIVVILVSAIAGGIYRGVLKYKEYLRNVPTELTTQVDTIETITTDIDGINDKRTRETQSKNEESDTEKKRSRIHPKLLSILAVGIIVGISVWAFMNVQENAHILKLTNQKVTEFIFNVSIGYIVCFIAFFAVLLLVLYFIKICYRVIQGIFVKENMEDDAIKCISIIFTLAGFFVYKDATLQDFLQIMNGADKMAPLLVMIAVLILGGFISMVVYKTLFSFINSDGVLLKRTDTIFREIVDIIYDIINKLLEKAKKIPNLLDIIFSFSKTGLEVLKQTLFVDDEDA